MPQNKKWELDENVSTPNNSIELIIELVNTVPYDKCM